VSTPTAARALALQILRAIDQRRGFSNTILAEHLVRSELSRRDRGLVTALVYGVLRHQRRLDALIDGVAHEPRRLSSRLREILRVAALELRELAHPPHAVLSQAALLSREIDPSGASGRAVQAILSAIATRGDALDAALASGDALDVLELRWSIPRWLAGRWRRLLGEEVALARARALAEPPPIEVRVDLSRTTAAAVAEALRVDLPELEITAFDADPQALRLRGAGELSRHPLHMRGLLSIQALGSQQAVKLLAPRPGERIIDACAGMGTKTLQIAEMMERAGEIVAADQSTERIAELGGIRLRGGLDVASLRLEGVVADLTGEHPSLDACAPFDALLLDAPCTGLGNLARHPELRWTRRFEDVAARAELQARLLARCWSRVRAGGRLVYAVCSLEPEEGPQVIENFCRESDARISESASWTPEAHGCDGFFVARLERPG